MVEDLVGDNGSRFVIAAAAVALGLICLVVVLWFMKNRPSSPFIRGGKNRQPRLAVLDAAAIDTRRRLVLVRRDDVEHLIMIGGPTDVVIESRIVAAAPASQDVATTVAETAPPRPAPERRIAPPPEPRPSAAPLPPVSAMGQALYGETTSSPPAARPVSPVPAAAVAPPSAGVPGKRNPEDILDAARARVLPTAQPAPPAPAPVASPAPAAPPQAPQRMRDGDATVTRPAASPAPQPAALATNFESILDAEISGDLQSLTAGPSGRTTGASVAPAGERRDPRMGTDTSDPAARRKEPSLEEEMNRMLGEISARKT